MADQFDSVEHLLAVAPERLDELYFEAYPMLDDQGLVRLFKAAGFDGAIYMGSGETFDEVEYRVFDQSQITPISITCAMTGQPLDRFVQLVAAGGQLDGEDEECSLDEAICPSP